MATFERQIDALGGEYFNLQQDRAYVGGYNEGHTQALTDACLIAADADQVVAELVEMLEDLLTGGIPLRRWTASAETLLSRVKGRVM